MQSRYQNIYRGIVLNSEHTSRNIDIRVIDLATGKLIHSLPREYAAKVGAYIRVRTLKI